MQGNKIVHLQGFGVANPAGQPMTAHTPLVLGSTSSQSFTLTTSMARPSLYADDLPVFALEDLAHGALENLAIGRGNVESKWVVAPGDDLSPDLETRGGRQALENR